MKTIIVGVLAFLIALGGGSAFSISKARSASAAMVAEGAAAGDTGDAPANPEAGGDPDDADAQPDDAGADGSAPEGGTPADGDSTEGQGTYAVAGAEGAQPGAGDLPDAETEDAEEGPSVPASELGGTDQAGDLNPEGIQRMARIFTAMKPKEAAAVLERMTDLEVRGVMLQMGDRSAAAILSVFEPERAAALSRIVLGRRGAP